MKLRLKALLGVVLLAAGPVHAAEPLAAAGKAVAAGDYAAALADLKQLHGAQADQVTARFLRGTALAGSGKLEQAAAVFQKLIADHPRLPEPYNNLAAIYVREGRLAEAKTTLERGLRTDDRYAALYQNLSDVYVQMARASYAKALRIKSTNPPPALQVLTSLRTVPEAAAPITVASATPVAAMPAKVAAPAAKAKAVAEPTPKPVPVSEPVPTPKPVSASKPAVMPKPEPRPTVVAAVEPPSRPAPVVAKPKPASPPAPAAAPAAAPKPTVAAATPASATAPKPTVAAAAPAPATASPPPATPPATTPATQVATAVSGQAKAAAAERQSVIDTLQGWAAAWSQQNVSSYLDYYAVDYAPPGTSRSAWEAERRDRLTRPAWIKVTLSDIQVEVATPSQAEVTLVQHYTASDYRDVTRKRFTLVMRDGNWMITAERSLKVRH